MSITISERIGAFIKMGEILRDKKDPHFQSLREAVQQQAVLNPWFLISHMYYAIDAIAAMLEKKKLTELQTYYETFPHLDFNKEDTVAVISAGNIPLAGFHDFFSVLVSGNRYMGKLSKDDRILLPALAEILTVIEPGFKSDIEFVDKPVRFDKIIATGSNNSVRYFEYYFGKYPHILRHHRNSFAILSGRESDEELEALFDDIFLYFGLGCRSVSALFVPENYSFEKLIGVWNRKGKEIAVHHRYLNNLDYQKTVHLMNSIPYLDAGIALLIEKKQLASPIGIIYYQYYQDVEQIKEFMEKEKKHIQCVVSADDRIPDTIPFGKSQQPDITDHADGVDVIAWLAGDQQQEKN